MHWARVHSQLAAVRRTLGPCLRVLGLAYTGLGGMLALALVVSVALVPVAPALQQVAEPARQAVSNMVQPTTDAFTAFFGGGPIVHADRVVLGVPPDRASASFADAIPLDVTIQDGPETTLVDEPPAVIATTAPRPSSAVTQRAAPEAIDEIVGIEPVEVRSPHALEARVQPAPAAVLQIASQDVPRALPILPAPTETALQVKARKDTENQAAIDAAKAAQTRARAEADAANNAAIAARKAATATATPAPIAPAIPTVEPSVAATNGAQLVATPHVIAPSNTTANQAAIDAAKLLQARAKAAANAANQAAIDAAKGPKGSAKATSTPTVQPTPPPGRPTAQPAPTNSAVEIQAAAVSVAVLDQHVDVDEAVLEDAPTDQATTLAAPEAA